MDTKSICPSCQKPLAPDVPMGLCPECLIKAGFPTGGETETGARSAFTPPTVEAIARLFPQLEVLELIGKGGMGAVYKARQKRLNRFVALKILPPGIGQEPAFAERFTREAQALAQLNHPGIVTLYEFGETEGQFYFLMEFVDGVNLRQLLANSRVSTREALAIVPQICDALQFAHDQGIVHRDIKPENILMDRRGRVKVADFGLAKIIGSEATSPFGVPPSGGSDRLKPELQTLTDAGKVMGTPQYMSPEQIQAPGEVDHRADIYALGVVFYQMLTGELPGKKIEPPSRKVHIDVRLDEIVLRALEKKPELRYQQVSEVKTLVETIVATPPGSSLREDAQTENLASGIRKSQMVRLVETLFGVTFTSGRAILGINLSALGFLGFLSYLSYLPLNWARKFEVFSGAFGLFGLIGVAFVFEFWARRRKSGTTPSGTSRRVDAQIENPEIEIRKSPMVRLVETLTGVTFTSGRAILGINFSVLGFLGFLGCLSYLPSAWARKFQAFSYAFGLFGLIGVAFIFEFWARLKKSGTTSVGGNRREEALTENSEIGNRKSEMVPHFSRTAIVGIAWAAFGVISAIQILAVRHISITELNDSVWWRVLNLFGQPVLALTAIPGTTILGWIAVTQIRRSAGKLYGLWLAVFDGLVFPLLVLDGIICALCFTVLKLILRVLPTSSYRIQDPGGHEYSMFLVWWVSTLIIASLVDWLIIRRVWRAVDKGVADVPSAAPARGSYPGKMMGIGFGGSVLIGVLLVLLLLALKVHHQLSTIDQIVASKPGEAGTPELNGPLLRVTVRVLDVPATFDDAQLLRPSGLLDSGEVKILAAPYVVVASGSEGAIELPSNEGIGAAASPGSPVLSGRTKTLYVKPTLEPGTAHVYYTLDGLVRGVGDASHSLARQSIRSDGLQLGELQLTESSGLPNGRRQLVVISTELEVLKADAAGNILTRPSASPELAFGPVIERTLTADPGLPPTFLRLHDGSLVFPPTVSTTQSANAFADWWRSTQADFMAAVMEKKHLLVTLENDGAKFAPIQGDKWDGATVAELADSLKNGTSLQAVAEGGIISYVLSEPVLLPATFAVESRTGETGLLQITGFTENPCGVKIRYKLAHDCSEAFTNSLIERAFAQRAARDEFQVRWVAADDDTHSPMDVLPAGSGQPPLRVLRDVVLSSMDVESAGFSQYQAEEKKLEVFLNPRGRDKFAQATAQNIHRQLAVVWRGRVIWSPRIQAEIVGAHFGIPVKLADAEAQQLLDVLNNRAPAKPATNAPAAEQAADQEIARLKLRQAELAVKAAELKFSVGTITEYELQKIKLSRDLAAAEVKNDQVEVARLKLAMAELDLAVVGKKVALGLAPESEYDQAKLARDSAAIRYKQAQTADDSSHR